MAKIWATITANFDWFYMPNITWSDVVEIIIISYLLYHILLWFKTSRAWTLLKGIIILLVFIGLAALFRFNTILWIARNTVNVGIIALIILFQPELRRALEELGRKKIFRNIFVSEEKHSQNEKVSDKTIYELVRTAVELGKAKTGALIVVEQETALGEYENTGISIDAVVTEQLLVNIFEKNTPLHDGAVIIRNNRVVAATCYLPLTERSDINKELGTRHRAGLGISEISDSMTLIVSEETGGISVAYKGALYRDLDSDSLRKHLASLQNKHTDVKRFKMLKKGGRKHERKSKG